jgi:hypothetical protein
VVFTFEDLGGEIKYLRRLADKDDKKWSAFNASIGVSDSGSYAVAIRSSNYVILPHGELSVTTSGPIKNRVWFAELNDSLELENLRQIDFSRCGMDISRGVEDPKLLWRNGKWLFTGVAMEKHVPVARNCICYLDSKAEYVTKIEIIPGYETRRPEKNWMTAYKQPKKFDYIYDGNGIVKDGMVLHRLADDKRFSALRGNAHLVEMADGTYLGIMHTLRVTNRGRKYLQERHIYVEDIHKDYKHCFVRFSKEGWALEVSDEFRFVSEGIEFAAGIVRKGDDYVISFGKDDLSSHLAIIKQESVHKMLAPID